MKTISTQLETQIKDVIRHYKKCNGCTKRKLVTLGQPAREPAKQRIFRNDSGETVPPFAVMEATDVDVINGRDVIIIDKPSGDASKPHVFNAARSVASNSFGKWNWGTLKCAVTGTPTVGDLWGVSSGSWLLSSSGDPLVKMLGLLDTGFAMSQPFRESCPCGAGLVSLYETAGSGIPVSYKTTTSGSVKYELTFDSSTYSNGDQITVEFGITYLSSPVPSSIEMNLTSTSSPLPPIISSNRPFTLVSSINSTNATTTLNTTSQFRLSRTQSSPSVGVKYTIDAVLDYTTDWSSVAESLECNGWLNYIVGGIGGGSGVFMAWEQC